MTPEIPAMILAGGLSTRMGGGDKGLRPLAGQPVLAHVLARLRPQAGQIVLNANGDGTRFAALGLEVIADPVGGFPGPLAGILAAMLWAKGLGAERVASVPCDAPFLPHDLIARLAGAKGAAIAQSASGLHPVCGLWPVSAAPDLADLLARGERKVRAFAEKLGAEVVVFDTLPDPFANLNTPADLARAEARLC
jgi:molybdopterin-guanine dinucleotide biosynthesis protein A